MRVFGAVASFQNENNFSKGNRENKTSPLHQMETRFLQVRGSEELTGGESKAVRDLTA